MSAAHSPGPGSRHARPTELPPASRASIRRARLPDAATLACLGAASFTETFGHLYPAEDLRAYLGSAHSIAAWSAALEDAERAVWLSCLDDGTAVGFVTVGRCKLPVHAREPAAGEIQQLYVLAGHQNLRIGSRLMGTALAWCSSQTWAPVYIGVWSQNSGAQRFYERYGFKKIGEYGFPVGRTIDHEFILRRD